MDTGITVTKRLDKGSPLTFGEMDSNLDRIVLESQLRLQADTDIVTSIANETNRATAAETAIANNLAQEKSDRIAADSSLQAQIGDLSQLTTTNKTDLVSAVGEILNDLTNNFVSVSSAGIDETSRAVDAEQAIINNLNQEITNRTDTDSGLQQQITDNYSNLQGQIALEVSTRTNNVSNLQQQIDDITGDNSTSVSTLVSDIKDLQLADTAETSARIQNELAVNSELNRIISSVGLDPDGNFIPLTGTTYLANAVSFKDSVGKLDTILSGALSQVTAFETMVVNSSNDTNNNLSDEVSNRIANDNALQTQINIETGRALSAETNLSMNLGIESENRINADAGIQVELDGVELGAGLNTDGSYVTPTASNYLNGTASLADAINTLDRTVKDNDVLLISSLDAETNDRINAVANIQNQLDTEIDNRTTNDAATLSTAKAYADSLVVGLWDDRGNYDASTNVFPSNGGSGTDGTILRGDIWTISVEGTLGGVPVAARQTVRSLLDAPGQDSNNWAIGHANTDIDNSITAGVTGRAPSQDAVSVAIDNAVSTVLSSNVASATKLQTARTISVTGDLNWTSGGFDGTSSVTGVGILSNSGVSAGTYNNSSSAINPVTFDSKGRATYVGNPITITPDWTNVLNKPTTITGLNLTDLTAVSYDDPLMDGVATSGISTTVSRSDHIHPTDTSRMNVNQTLSLTGDVLASATALNTGTINTVLASTGVVAGSYGTDSQIPVFSVNSKGQITDVATVTVTPASIGAISNTSIGSASGVCELGPDARIPAIRLPSYMDVVVEHTTVTEFPATGTSQTIYVALDTGTIHRWSGSIYVEISPSPGSTDSVPEGAVNLYFTPARAQAAVTTIIGNAGSATKLQTARTISGTLFDGTANVIIDHAGLNNAGSNTHVQIDAALSRLADTSGINTGDETNATILSKLGYVPLPTNDGIFTGTLNGNGSAVFTGAKIRQTGDVVQQLGDINGNVSVSLANGNVVMCNPTANVAWSFTDLITGVVNTVVLNIANFFTYTHAFPVGTMWYGGSAPTGIPPSARVIVVFETYDSGVSWMASISWRSA